ncbi:MAG TPA: carboxypeptidase regulatory-like domain-containing protein [Pyrinomonadaceae bacterium]
MKKALIWVSVLLACFLLADSQQLFTPAVAQNVIADKKPNRTPAAPQESRRELKGSPVKATAKAVVNVTELARQQAERPPDLTPRVTVPPNPPFNEEDALPPGEIARPASDNQTSNRPDAPQIASPNPASSFIGHNDVPKVGTGNIVIPPDTQGAVGLTNIVTFLNNNYVVQNKTTGAQVSAVSEDTFWTGIGATGPFDPHILYDPYNDRWIAVAVSDAQAANSSIVIGVSQTGNPAGAYFLFRFDVDATNANWADFPLVGFNKNWVSINVSMIVISSGASAGGKNLVLDYAQLRTGTFAGGVFNGTPQFASPAITYSTTETTLYVPAHLSSGGATYEVDTITGTPPTPAYALGATKTRTGGGWVQPSGQILPQAAPLSGASVCGATPCKLETQDAQIRANPIFRNGFIYYAQTVGLPSAGLTHTAAQWTKIDAVTGNFADGGRVEDPTATATNGGKWYAYPSLSVNVNNDVMLGFSQFSSAQFAAAGYTYRFHSDAPGLMRDPVIYKAGEDYYHKDFGSVPSRNRYGDYSTTQVDPSNDKDLWTLEEYAMARVGTDDGTTGSNSSRWSTWWAKVAFDPTAAMFTIGGRVQTADGRGIGRATVSLTDQNSQVRTAITNPFGYYRFYEVESGMTYVVSVRGKGIQFTPQVINVIGEDLNINFTPQ